MSTLVTSATLIDWHIIDKFTISTLLFFSFFLYLFLKRVFHFLLAFYLLLLRAVSALPALHLPFLNNLIYTDDSDSMLDAWSTALPCLSIPSSISRSAPNNLYTFSLYSCSPVIGLSFRQSSASLVLLKNRTQVKSLMQLLSN